MSIVLCISQINFSAPTTETLVSGIAGVTNAISAINVQLLLANVSTVGNVSDFQATIQSSGPSGTFNIAEIGYITSVATTANQFFPSQTLLSMQFPDFLMTADNNDLQIICSTMSGGSAVIIVNIWGLQMTAP
jgi:hypothetical protein